MRAVTYVLSYASSDIRALTCVLRTGRSGRAVHLLYLAGDLTWTFTCYELAATLLSPRCELDRCETREYQHPRYEDRAQRTLFLEPQKSQAAICVP